MWSELTNQSQKLLAISLLALIVVSSTCISLSPTVSAAEPDFENKTLSILSDVIGLKTEEYTTTKSTQRDSQYLSQQRNENDMLLASAQGSLRVTCSYVKNTLQLVYFSDLEGEPSLKHPVTNTVEMAKGLLGKYQNYSSDVLYGQLALSLEGMQENANVTKYNGNIKLDATAFGDRVSYKWTYIDKNGVEAERKNVIVIYDSGSFKGFFNNWPLYTIADTTPKLSAQQATELAIEASKNYSYPVIDENGTEIMVSGFSIAPESLGHAKLIYVNNKAQEYARGGDPYEMYLAWCVPLGFDKFYPGSVSGLTVILWADTGKVCGLNRVIVDDSFVPSNATVGIKENTILHDVASQQSGMLPILTGVTAVMGIVVGLTLSTRVIMRSNKLSSPKRWATMLCAIIVISAVVSIPIANGDYMTGRSRIYSAIGTPGGYQNDPADEAEEDATEEVCDYIEEASNDGGYTTTNHCLNTVASYVISNAGYDEETYVGTMVFYSGHFAVPNNAVQDKNGDPIYGDDPYSSSDIYSQTGLGKHFFTFLWVCVNAETQTSGTPVAWTHRDGTPGHPLMDSNGFGAYSDGLGQCYISFQGFSPMLSTYYQSYETSVFYEYNQRGDIGPCKEFIIFFYYFALYQEYSVADSLDLASNYYFACDYTDTDCVLNSGYNSYWPGGAWDEPLDSPGYYPIDFYPENSPNKMRVFGDSNIKLSQPELTLSTNIGLAPTFTINSQQYGPGTYHVVNDKTYSFTVNDIPGYQFDYFLYNGIQYSRPHNFHITQDSTVTAHYTFVPYINILSSTGGYTNPSAGWYTGSGGMYITAYEDSGYHFVEWRQNGDFLSSNPTVYVYYGTNTVQPVFAPDNPQYYSVNIRGWEDVYCTEIYPNIYLNGNYYGTCEIYDTLQEGYYTFTADQYYDQFSCYYVVVTDGGQWMAWGNSVSLTLSSSTTIDFYYTGY